MLLWEDRSRRSSYEPIVAPEAFDHAPYVECRRAPIWTSEHVTGTAAQRLALKGATSSWLDTRKRPVPQLVKGRFDAEKAPMLHGAKHVALEKGLVFATPN